MRECICGKGIARRKEKGHREREYCSDRCRQKAYRERHKGLLSLKRSIDEKYARMNNQMYQDYQRETWEDDLERKDKFIKWLDEDIADLKKELEWCNVQKNMLELTNEVLEAQLAEKEVEVARLQSLLDAMSKRKK